MTNEGYLSSKSTIFCNNKTKSGVREGPEPDLGVLTLGPMIPSLVAQSVKNLPAVQETRVPSLGWEDPLEEEMATHSSILARKIPWTEEPRRLQSMGSHRVRHD